MENNRCSKKPWSDRKNRLKIFFKNLTMDSDSPTPITFDQTLSEKHPENIHSGERTDGRTEYERTRFATQRMTLLSVEGTTAIKAREMEQTPYSALHT